MGWVVHVKYNEVTRYLAKDAEGWHSTSFGKCFDFGKDKAAAEKARDEASAAFPDAELELYLIREVVPIR